ncbi:MAG: tetratricopeptide repeat protein [Ruminococcaceae bacterium]|nr:tetratricopeptide repeat protein [Oscillospiraceae bacterium]
MNRYLENDYTFKVNEKNGSFEIKETIGRGASCVVYRADFIDENGNITEHILKEYNPKSIELFREETGELVLESEDDSEDFVLGLEHFVSGYQKQLDIRRISELKNATTNIQDIYCANGTKYIDMTCFNGLTYSKVKEKSLYDLLRRIKALTCVIANYHNAGFLHLDIKPENIYTIPETTEFLMLFDFDSVVEKSNIGSNSVLSYTMSWAAPEQITKNYSKICEATDLFAVGEILFYQIMGRHSSTRERRSFADYQFDCDSAIFENTNPRVYPLLKEIFHKTICTVADKRFQSADDLIKALDRVIALADPKAPFIRSSLPEPQSFFVGRKNEIEEIHTRLDNNRILFVSGVGGIGKSELVKQYAKKYKNEYDAVIFAPYVSDMNILIADDTAVPVYNFFKYPAEQPEEYVQRKWRKLKELCDEDTLIIVDNLDRDDDPDINKLLELGCKLLITTRVDFSDYSYEQLNIKTLADREEVNAIFNEYYKKPLDEKAKSFVREIIDIVDGHTMTVELLAKQMTAGRITPEKMLSKLKEGGIGDSGKEKVLTSKDGVRSALRAYEHIRALFDVSDLNENELYVLANLSLIPHTGVPTELFHDWCELDGYDDINELVHTGWVRCDKEKDFISLHPVIKEIAKRLPNLEMLCKKSMLNICEMPSLRYYELIDQNKLAGILRYSLYQIIKLNFCTNSSALYLHKVAKKIRGYGDLDIIELSCKRSLEIRIKHFGEKSLKVIESYLLLSQFYRDKGKLQESQNICKKLLDIGKELYEPNCRKYMKLVLEQAILNKFQGNFLEAEELFLQVNHFSEKTEERSLALSCLLNLGDMYSAMGKYKLAEKYLQKYLDSLAEQEEKNCLKVSTAHRVMSVCYRDMNELEKALNHITIAFDIAKTNLTENHRTMAKIYSVLGSIYLKNGDFKKAQNILEKSLKIRLEIYGEEHRDTAFAYFRLGELYEKTKQYNDALECYEYSETIRNNLFGVKHYQTVLSQNKIEDIYMLKVMLSARQQLLKKVSSEDHTKYISDFQFVSCPDQITGEIKVINKNGTFFVEYKKSENIKTFVAENNFCRQDDKICTTENDRCVLILESPHKAEYETIAGEKQALGPAQGSTGRNIESYFVDLLMTALNNKIIAVDIKDNESKTFDLVLMNAIQFQCSLEKKTTLYRDAMFHLCWQRGKTVDNFTTRLTNTVTDNSIIINCCTKGNFAKQLFKSKGVLKTKNIEGLQLGVLENYELCELVATAIKKALPHKTIFNCEHPYRWFVPEIKIE